MKIDNFFNIHRYLAQLRRDIALYAKTIMYLFAALLLPYLFKLLRDIVLQTPITFSINFQITVFTIFFFLTIMLIAANSFRDLRNDINTQMYLLIPTSSFEKFLSMWTLIFVLLPIAFILYYIPVNGFFLLISKITGAQHVHYFPFFGLKEYLKEISPGFMISTVSIFFAGGASFKKDAWLKTIGVVILVLMGFTIAVTFSLWILKELLQPENLGFYSYWEISTDFDVKSYTYYLTKIISWLGLFILWAIAYFKLTEKQA